MSVCVCVATVPGFVYALCAILLGRNYRETVELQSSARSRVCMSICVCVYLFVYAHMNQTRDPWRGSVCASIFFARVSRVCDGVTVKA